MNYFKHFRPVHNFAELFIIFQNHTRDIKECQNIKRGWKFQVFAALLVNPKYTGGGFKPPGDNLTDCGIFRYRSWAINICKFRYVYPGRFANILRFLGCPEIFDTPGKSLDHQIFSLICQHPNILILKSISIFQNQGKRKSAKLCTTFHNYSEFWTVRGISRECWNIKRWREFQFILSLPC